MNFLAHLALAENDSEARVGQVLADFVSAGSIGTFSRGIQDGILAHQRIDSFSDDHPVFASARCRLHPPYRRYGGVLVDVFFDHFLARGWTLFGNGDPLPDFATSCYRSLNAYRHLGPDRFGVTVKAMTRDNWLVSYAELRGVDRTLRGIAKRCKYDNPLGTGVSVLEANYEGLRSDFELFFPQLRSYVETLGSPASLRDSKAEQASAPRQAGALPPVGR